MDYSISEDIDESNGVLDIERDFRTRFELDEVEKRFREMFKNVNPSAEDDEDEENFVENLKKFENDISHHEYQDQESMLGLCLGEMICNNNISKKCIFL